MKVYQQCWKEWEAWCAQKGAQKNAISAPILADSLISNWVGLAHHFHLEISNFSLLRASLHS